MSVSATSSRTGRRLNASGRARRAKRVAARRRRQMFLSGAIAFTAVFAAPLSVASYLGIESKIPGVAAAKSFMAMMSERSPGDRTKAELSRTKQRTVAAPKQRALGKITPAPPPKEFVEAHRAAPAESCGGRVAGHGADHARPAAHRSVHSRRDRHFPVRSASRWWWRRPDSFAG